MSCSRAEARWLGLATAGLVLAEGFVLAPVGATGTGGHAEGLIRYARVERPDGAYREMLVDPVTLDRLREGREPTDNAWLLMESYYEPGRIGSVFAKRRIGGSWRYGTIAAGDAARNLRPQAACAGCHGAAAASGGTFMLDLLRAFARDGKARLIRCDRPGRAPCEVASYAAAGADLMAFPGR